MTVEVVPLYKDAECVKPCPDIVFDLGRAVIAHDYMRRMAKRTKEEAISGRAKDPLKLFRLERKFAAEARKMSKKIRELLALDWKVEAWYST